MSEKVSVPELHTNVELFEGELPPRDEVISTFTDKLQELREKKSNLEDTPGFKFSNGQYEKQREISSIDSQLIPFEKLWDQCGGEEIDAAQELVDGLNFKSTAEDHVYAKKRLQEAKDNFYDNLKTAMETEEPTHEDTVEDLDGENIRDAAVKIKDHGLEGIGRQKKEEHAARGLRAIELKEKRIRELNRNNSDPTPTPEDPAPTPMPEGFAAETEEKKRSTQRLIGAVFGTGALLVGAVIGGYVGNKTGVQINSPRALTEQLQAGGHGFSLLGRISARLENAFQSATGFGGEWSPSEALKALNPFGSGGKSYMLETFENTRGSVKAEWGRVFSRMLDFINNTEGGEEKLDRFLKAREAAGESGVKLFDTSMEVLAGK